MLAQRALLPPGPVVTSPRVTELLTGTLGYSMTRHVFDKSQIFHHCPCLGRHQEARTRLEPPALVLRPWSSVEVLAVASPPSRDNSVTFEKEKCFRANCHLLALCCTASDTKMVETSHVAELQVLLLEWKECSPGCFCLTAPRSRLPPLTSGQPSSNLGQ